MSYQAKVRKVTESLPVQLTDKERLEFADKLAEGNRDLESKIEHKRSVNKNLDFDISEARLKAQRLNDTVATKCEYRMIDVEERTDYEADLYTRTRVDTGEIIFERKLNHEEKQLEMIENEDDA